MIDQSLVLCFQCSALYLALAGLDVKEYSAPWEKKGDKKTYRQGGRFASKDGGSPIKDIVNTQRIDVVFDTGSKHGVRDARKVIEQMTKASAAMGNAVKSRGSIPDKELDELLKQIEHIGSEIKDKENPVKQIVNTQKVDVLIDTESEHGADDARKAIEQMTKISAVMGKIETNKGVIPDKELDNILKQIDQVGVGHGGDPIIQSLTLQQQSLVLKNDIHKTADRTIETVKQLSPENKKKATEAINHPKLKEARDKIMGSLHKTSKEAGDLFNHLTSELDRKVHDAGDFLEDAKDRLIDATSKATKTVTDSGRSLIDKLNPNKPKDLGDKVKDFLEELKKQDWAKIFREIAITFLAIAAAKILVFGIIYEVVFKNMRP